MSGLPGALKAQNTLVPEGMSRYEATAFPDRIVLVVTEDPAHSQTVNWRTDTGVSQAQAQIVKAQGGAGLHLDAQLVEGRSLRRDAGNGPAHHHSVTFTGLAADTLYAYRVRGRDTWSEWFQFRTAGERHGDFAFMYFGDAQNSVKSHFSRVIREANVQLPRPALMIHAGDLINQRSGRHDDEWGEWFEAGSFLHAMSPAMPVTGNHEHAKVEGPGGSEAYQLDALWPAQFTVPANGPASLKDSVYFTRYQGVLFVSLDSTMALEDEALAIEQARWLDSLLALDNSRWVVISHHHPIFSVSEGRDNPLLRQHWLPLYEKYGVDLVLQGHDHTYGRGPNIAEGATMVDGEAGTVYVVSVAGPKMYRVSDQARDRMLRTGEDVQLFQIIHVREDRLIFESRLAHGELYDAFELIRGEGGKRVVNHQGLQGSPDSRCGNPEQTNTRCWGGTEFVAP